MYTPIENMPDTSRIWIYQSNRKLNPSEIQFISETLKQFCSQWAAHGSALQTSFDVSHERFIVLSVNEQLGSASGCSIDSSTHILKNLEQKINIDFFSRSEVAFLENNDVVAFPLSNLKKLFAEGRLNENSTTLNTLVSTLGEWRGKSTMKVGDSWLKRYVPKVSVA